MAQVSFNYAGVGGVQNIINATNTDIDFSKFINDYNSGRLVSASYYLNVSVTVFNVAMNQTVSCVIRWFDQSYTYEFTSRYESTTERPLYKEINIPVDTYSLVQKLKANGNKVRVSITSGSDHFKEASIGLSVKPVNAEGVTDYLLSGKEVDTDLYIDMLPANVNGGYVDIYKVDTNDIKIGEFYSTSNRITIPKGTITDISKNYKIYVGNAAILECNGVNKSNSASILKVFSGFTVSEPTIDNVSYIGDLWEKPITINWRSSQQEGYEYELYYNNVKIKSGSGLLEKEFIIPANTFSGTMPASARVRVYKTFGGTIYYSRWDEVNIPLKDITATISNLIVNGKYWENDIELSWQSTYQQQFRVEAWKNNIKEYEQTGTTTTRFIIPKNTLSVGEYTFKVWVAYANRFVNSQSLRQNLVDILPEVSNLSLSGSNIDYDLTFSWESLNQSVYELKVTKSDAQTLTFSGTTEKNKLFAVGSLIAGSTLFEIRIGYNPSVGQTRWTTYKTLNITLVESLPSIGVLQPDGQLLLKEDNIRAYWTSANQTNWSLKIGSEVTASGTLETEYIIKAGTLSTGTKTMELTINFITASGVTKTAKKTSQFLVTGKPASPTFTSATSFVISRPVISWDSSEQEGYKLDILNMKDELIWTTEWRSGLVLRQKVFEYLANGTYKARLQIINAFGEKSAQSIYQFTVSAVKSTPITLNVNSVDNGNVLTWNNPTEIYYKFYIVRNGIVIARMDPTQLMVFDDYTCSHGINTYKIMGVTDLDVYTDSNEVTINTILSRNTIALINDASNYIYCDKVREGGSIDLNHSVNGQLVHLTGRVYPVLISSEFSDTSISIDFVNSDVKKLYNMIESRNEFIYRDTFGNTVYCAVNESRNSRTVVDNQTSITFNVIDYTEEVEYD